MAAPATPAEERYDTPADLDRKTSELAALITKSKHFIVFTGAGISTSAGIADFRGPTGVWTLRAQGRSSQIQSVNTLQAIPTPTHMALVALQDANILTHLVSQNCDGLHRRSGILPGRISELHGNSNRETCAKGCGREYLRDFRAVATYEKTVHDHRTGRKCAVCGGNLYDTIVNFGEYLPEKPLADAREHAAKADLCLVLGSSLTVPPACDIPEITAKRRFGKGKLVIVNLQETPLDERAGLRIWARADEAMGKVMEKLGVEVPRFVLRRRLAVEVKSLDAERHAVTLRGVDVDGTPVTFIQSVRMEGNRRAVKTEPFTISFRRKMEPGDKIDVEVEFMGHYGEPNLTISHVYGSDTGYLLEYDPSTGEWKVEKGEVAVQ
ncbi:DHS-like NAD/FAD-binding domain-containing protein [Podospora aff. communis PSN243]|uniref:protein acetyllysine N-acetyltransferase n=1 Tax=Podospora aff. communis PSN243 TaxID=3040156 RepID=A0AAV9GSQ6_9PEZI|nr:DHS-like NAD/FAD-binding domain-containing protein [Podospora aff. communis PSN243]